MKELFNRYKDEEEVIPTGDVASTSNEPSPSQKPLTDEEEVAKFQQQQRKSGKMWDEEKQSWVDAPDLKMELNKPGKIGATKDIQARLDQDARAKEAKESFGDYGDVSSELGDKNVQSEYQKIYETQGKDAAESFMDEQFTKRNQGVADREVAAKAEADQENQKSEQDYRNSMDQQYMEDLGVGDLYKAPTTEGNQPQTNQPSQSFEGYEYGEEPESDEFFDKGYFGQNQFRNLEAYQKEQAAAREAARRKAQQQASNKQQNVPQSDIAVNKQKGKQVQNKSYTSSEEAKVKAKCYASMDEYLEEKRRAESMFDDNRTESEKKADEEAYAKARVAEKEREKREANDPELQKQKRQTEKINSIHRTLNPKKAVGISTAFFDSCVTY
jgi:hypothetical protein